MCCCLLPVTLMEGPVFRQMHIHFAVIDPRTLLPPHAYSRQSAQKYCNGKSKVS